MAEEPRTPLEEWQEREHQTQDVARPDAVAKRHARGGRTARENLAALVDPNSFVEYGALAVAAQRGRRSVDDLRAATPGDGVITGVASVNGDRFTPAQAKTVVVINDFTVLAGTQGYFHHKKIDRMLDVARAERCPILMFVEGGGGRPGDVDVQIANSGLTVPTFLRWSALQGVVPRIAVAHGYTFAGNAALFGSADIGIATKQSFLGMAGPAMIEGGGLGRFAPKEIGPIEVQSRNGVVDLVVEDEAEATVKARQLLSYFQGSTNNWTAPDPEPLRTALPEDRRFSYKIRPIIEHIADSDSFLELRREYGGSVITGLLRIEGQPMGVLANDTRVLGGALDSAASLKAARFLEFLDDVELPVLSLCDTPGFMVGPDSEAEGAVRHMSQLFVAGARVQTPWFCVFLRKGYGLGAMAMAGGSLDRPTFTASWPQGEFGAMGLEGAVQLGFARELDAAATPDERKALFDRLLQDLYNRGKAIEAASFLELDAVIDPTDTRRTIANLLPNAIVERL
ncbi:MAG: carboxyl transferase domain-containing protein [Myxococcota bacterium]